MGLVRWTARRLEATPSADELDSVISVWVDDLGATGIGDERATEVADAMERCARVATRWPLVRDVIALLPPRAPPSTPSDHGPDPAWLARLKREAMDREPHMKRQPHESVDAYGRRCREYCLTHRFGGAIGRPRQAPAVDAADEPPSRIPGEDDEPMTDREYLEGRT